MKLRKRWNLIASMAAIVLVGCVGFLVVANYLSQVDLQKASLEQLRQESRRHAMALSYFFLERKNDLRYLAQDRALSVFFENKALGMSMQYGLRASLFGISQLFDRLLEEKKVGEDRIYDGMAFVDPDGGLLVERNFLDTRRRLSEAGWKDIADAGGSEPAIFIEPQADSITAIMVIAPYYHRGRYAGRVVAEVSLETIYKHLVKVPDLSDRSAYLISIDGHPFLPADIPLEIHSAFHAELMNKDLGQVHRLDTVRQNGGSEGIFVSCAPIDGAPFFLMSIFSSSEVLGHTSIWRIPLAMGILSCTLLGGLIMAWRINTRNLILSARLDEAAAGKRGVEEKNRQLEREISERKRAEVALMESEKRYRRFFEDDLSGAFITSPEGRILACNPAFARIFGFSSVNEALNADIFDLYRDRAIRDAFIERLAKERKIHHFEAEYLRADGMIIQTIENVTGSFDEWGKLVEIKGFIIDNTEHKRLEEQLRRAHKMEAIGTLAGGIAHDFNNILTAIIGHTEMAMLRCDEANPLRHNMEQVLRAGNRAKDLIKQILAFSRQHEQERRDLRLSPIVKETLKFLRASIPATIEIQQNLWAESVVVLADPVQIHRVLMNLCANAAHAMRDKGGILEVSLLEVASLDACPFPEPQGIGPGPFAVLRVCDTGCGIDPDVIDRIFDPFFTTKGPGEGTGMGLAVVHGIIKSHGGEITVESEPGKGTCIYVFIPAVQGECSLEEDVPVQPVPPCMARKRVLLVDDEEILLELGQEMLELAGFEVIALSSSTEALRTFRTRPEWIDLVITDQTMPKMTGTELAHELVSIRPEIPIILCTGYSDAIKTGGDHPSGIREFMMKPFVYTELIEIAHKLLSGNDSESSGH